MTKPFRPFALVGLLAAITLPALAGGPRGGPDQPLQQLDLTVEQRAQISEIKQTRMVEMREARLEVRQSDRSLAEAIEAGADKIAIADLAIARHEAQQVARELRQSMRADMHAVLSDEQAADLQEIRGQRGQGQGGHGALKKGQRGPRGR